MKPVRVTPNIFQRLGGLEDYSMEVKLDGWRAILIVESTGPTLWTRDKVRIDMSNNLKEEFKLLNLPVGTMLDGEIWNPLKRGSWRHNPQVQCRLSFWDAIRSGSRDLSELPLHARRAEMLSLLGNGTESIRLVEPVQATLEEYLRIEEIAESFRNQSQTRSGFIHGVVLKRNDSPRRDHAIRCVEHPDWLKIVISGM